MHSTTKRFGILVFMVFTIVALFSTTCFAAINIRNLNDLNANSNYEEIPNYSIWHLKPGEYSISDSNSSTISLVSRGQTISIGEDALTYLGIIGGRNTTPLLQIYELHIEENAFLRVEGANTGAITLDLGAIFQNGGQINLYASSGTIRSNAVEASYYMMSSGTLFANGGRADFGIALYVSDFSLSGGTVTALGGAEGDGIYALQLFGVRGGVLDAIGGTSMYAYGVYTNALIQLEGEVRSHGGSGNSSPGIRVSGQFIQSSGNTISSGSSRSTSPGMWIIGQFVQLNGSLTAIGGNRADSVGICFDETLAQMNGLITAVGGNSRGSYGINVRQNAYIGGELYIMAGGVAPAIRVGSPSAFYNSLLFKAPPIFVLEQAMFAQNAALTFSNKSKLSVELDFSQKNPPAYIELATQNLAVAEGSKIELIFKNFDALKQGETREFTIVKLNSGKLETADLFELVNPKSDEYDISFKLNAATNELIVVVKKLN